MPNMHATVLFRIALITLAALLGSVIIMLPVVPKRPVFQHTLSSATLYGVSDASTAGISEIPSLSPPQITSGAAIVYDPLDNVIIFAKNAAKPLGIASITKIMTAVVALERIGKDDVVEIPEEAVETEGNEGELTIGEHFTLHDLVMVMLTTSSNDAAAALARHVGFLYGAISFEESQKVFVRLMNETAQKLNLPKTRFENPTGLDTDESAGIISNVSTAEEIAKLISYAIRYPLIEHIYAAPSAISSQENIVHPLSSTHTLLTNEPGVISGKTGFTDNAGGTLATVAEIPIGKLAIVVVLDSTRSDRFDDTLRLFDWLRAR